MVAVNAQLQEKNDMYFSVVQRIAYVHPTLLDGLYSFSARLGANLMPGRIFVTCSLIAPSNKTAESVRREFDRTGFCGRLRLMSCSPAVEMFGRAAPFAHRIVMDAKPRDLLVEQRSNFDH